MPWYVIVIIILAVLGVCGYVVYRLGGLFRRAEGLIDDIKGAQIQEEEVPKSLNAMDELLYPQILRDFPEYNRAVLENRVREDTMTFYESAMKGEYLYKDRTAASLRDKIVFPDDVRSGIVIHRTALSAYDSRGRDKLITYQASVQYEGKDDRRHQKRLILKYIAAYDNDFSDNIEVLKCPNCGAPVPTMGEKVCRYCGAALKTSAGMGWVLINAQER